MAILKAMASLCLMLLETSVEDCPMRKLQIVGELPGWNSPRPTFTISTRFLDQSHKLRRVRNLSTSNFDISYDKLLSLNRQISRQIFKIKWPSSSQPSVLALSSTVPPILHKSPDSSILNNHSRRPPHQRSSSPLRRPFPSTQYVPPIHPSHQPKDLN